MALHGAAGLIVSPAPIYDYPGKLFRFLGPHLVNDLIHLHVKIHAERSG